MGTQGDDYARRFAEWQQAEAAARQARIDGPPPPERQYKGWEVFTREAKNAERSEWYRRRILNSITSAPMRDALEEAHRLAVANLSGISWKRSELSDYLTGREGNNVDARLYRDWLRAMLAKSDLAQRIPDGRQALPDVYEAMGALGRIARLSEPRSYPQLVQHIVNYLDWYLEPTHKVKPPYELVWIGLALFGFAAASVLYVLTDLHFDMMFVYAPLVITGLLASAVTLLLGGGQKTPRGVLVGHYKLRRFIHAAELYYYLVDEWADLPESGTP